MALINEVYEYIENKYKPNEPIFLAELDIPDMKPVSVRQQMKKLTEEGRLKRFDAGIYYIPKKSMFRSGSTLSIDARWCQPLWLCWRNSLCKSAWSDYTGSSFV